MLKKKILIFLSMDGCKKYCDLNVVRLVNGGYLVKTESMGDKIYRRERLEQIFELVKEAKDLEGDIFYAGFDEDHSNEKKTLEFYLQEILEDRERFAKNY